MKDLKDGRRTHLRIMLTSLSAMAAETATFPIDMIKTRVQLHGESVSCVKSTSSIRVATEILRKQGFLGLYKGLSPAILRHIFYTPTRIVCYEYLRNVGLSDSIAIKAIAGGLSGGLAQIIASPADLIKVRMQAQGRILRQSNSPIYNGTVDAFLKIIKTEGLHGLWTGVLPNIQRAFLVNMGELACYDQAKHVIIDSRFCDDNIYAHTLASIISGLSSTALSCPADVIKTRMMNQMIVNGGEVMYKSSYVCLLKTVKIEGVGALWKGFFPTWARLGPWQFVFWVSYEKFRQITELSSF